MSDAEATKQASIAAMRYLMRREHTRQELMQKLARKDLPEDAIAAALDALEAKGLLDESRFAEAFIAVKARAGYGARWIQAALRQKGLSDGEAAMALESAEVDWHAVASDALQRKCRQKSQATAQQLTAFLLRKGHTHETAFSVVSDWRYARNHEAGGETYD